VPLTGEMERGPVKNISPTLRPVRAAPNGKHYDLLTTFPSLPAARESLAFVGLHA
jgi:hypothetical protein